MSKARQRSSQERPRVLLHVCCGPCAQWPVKSLRDEGFEVDAYFFNPNIHPQAELDKRLENMEKMAQLHQVKLYSSSLSEEERWRKMKDLEKDDRCSACYHLRLMEAARFAAEKGYRYLATAMEVSPYQDHRLIQEAAERACQKFGIEFLLRPFWDHFREGQEMAKEDELYRQKYCGCVLSLGETAEKYRKKVLRAYDLPEDYVPGVLTPLGPKP